MVTANNDLWADSKGKLVKTGDKAKVLVARAGRIVPKAYADQVTATGNIKVKKSGEK